MNILLRATAGEYVPGCLTALFGLGILGASAASNLPSDIVTNWENNPELAALAVIGLAALFGVSALLIVAGIRDIVGASSSLEINGTELTTSRLFKGRSKRRVREVVRLVVMPDREHPRVWALEFNDGDAFVANSRIEGFDDALAWALTTFADNTAEMTIAEFEPAARRPSWLPGGQSR